ncbi:MAG: IS21 family transposase [Clostridia bacterium]|nr:IS21 family transposase [Clostridia bacterium]
MPIELEKYRAIRRMALQGMGSREIARVLKVGRNTVKKYRDGALLPAAGKAAARHAPIREAIEGDVIRMLKENAALPRKERRTAHDMWVWLVSEKRIAVSEGHVRRIVHELRDAAGEEFLPLRHDAAEAMQVDWGDMAAYIGGVKTVVSVFVAVLPHSCAPCAFVYPDKTMLSFADGHVRAFSFWKGVARTCVYDNLKQAVRSGTGRHAVKQDNFMRLEAHYGFESVFCNRAAGWEKSNVENGVGIIRSIAFTPAPRVGDYAELQAHIDANVHIYIRTHKVRGHANSVADDLENERRLLLPLPQMPLDICDTCRARVRPDQTVAYDGVRYSVPHGYVGRDVSLRVSPYHVEVYWRGELLHKHDKANIKGQDQYILDHYLDALSKKPRAIDQALPLSRGVMPPQCAEFLRLCPGGDAKRQLVDILLDGRGLGRERTLGALGSANKTGSPSYQLVQFYLAEQAPKPYDSFEIEHGDLSMYDRLIGGDGDD